MRSLSQRVLRHAIAATAAVLLTPLATAGPPAAAADFGPTAFTGTAYLPDGVTLAPAAVVDLSLPGGPAQARAVSGPDGTFSLEIAETDELVALALGNEGQVTLDWLLSKLFRNTDLQAGRSVRYETTPAVAASGGPAVGGGGGTVIPNPAAIYARETGQLVLTLVNEAQQRVANALDATADLEFHLPGPQTHNIVSKVSDAARASGVYVDPDLVAGNEDLDDPDLIPPLGALLDSRPGVITADGVARKILGDGTVALDDSDEPTGDACERLRDDVMVWGGENGTHPEGMHYYIRLTPYKCADDSNSFDYYMFKWHGHANMDVKDWYLWRLKFRSEWPSGYEWEETNPTRNQEDPSKAVTWTVGFQHKTGFYGEISGQYNFKAKKIHPWQDTKAKLLHTSWISNKSNGTHDDGLWNGYGWELEVPQGYPWIYDYAVQVWRCHKVSGSYSWGWSCDPRD